VLEGRDIATRVFPDAPYRFFLTADLPVRARRRCRELEDRGTPRPYEEVLSEMARRDEDDSRRADSPLTLDDRYTLVDSTELDADGVVSRIEGLVRKGEKDGNLTPTGGPP
jgi:CMP/dCMP kinase